MVTIVIVVQDYLNFQKYIAVSKNHVQVDVIVITILALTKVAVTVLAGVQENLTSRHACHIAGHLKPKDAQETFTGV